MMLTSLTSDGAEPTTKWPRQRAPLLLRRSSPQRKSPTHRWPRQLRQREGAWVNAAVAGPWEEPALRRRTFSISELLDSEQGPQQPLRRPRRLSRRQLRQSRAVPRLPKRKSRRAGANGRLPRRKPRRKPWPRRRRLRLPLLANEHRAGDVRKQLQHQRRKQTRKTI